MSTYILRIDKDLSKQSKYVVTSSTSKPEFVKTSSSGEKVVYLSSKEYGSNQIKPYKKLIGNKGHVSTLFPFKLKCGDFKVFTGDVKGTQDLLILLTKDFNQCYLIGVEGMKKDYDSITKKISESGISKYLDKL